MLFPSDEEEPPPLYAWYPNLEQWAETLSHRREWPKPNSTRYRAPATPASHVTRTPEEMATPFCPKAMRDKAKAATTRRSEVPHKQQTGCQVRCKTEVEPYHWRLDQGS